MPETRPLHPPGKWLQNAQVRLVQRHDGPGVLCTEQALKHPWDAEKILTLQATQGVQTFVAEVGPYDCHYHGAAVGHLIAEQHRTRWHVLRLAVHPDYRRHGIGRKLVGKLKSKLWAVCCRITMDVRESELSLQLLLQKERFRAVRITRNYYEDTEESGYRMIYEQPEHP